MLYMETTAVRSENQTEHIHVFCGHRKGFKLDGTQINHWPLKGHRNKTHTNISHKLKRLSTLGLITTLRED